MKASVWNRPATGPSELGPQDLCRRCGLCCDGTLFKDVQLLPADDALGLKEDGLRLTGSRSPSRLPRLRQPCGAFGEDRRCCVYPDRPAYCRQFECLLLKGTMAGRIEVRTALSIIRLARRRADKVRQLLEKLGNHDDRSPLSQRFRRVAKRMNHTQLDDGKGDLFGELTLAFHDLNLLLNEAFYPGAAAERLSG